MPRRHPPLQIYSSPPSSSSISSSTMPFCTNRPCNKTITSFSCVRAPTSFWPHDHHHDHHDHHQKYVVQLIYTPCDDRITSCSCVRAPTSLVVPSRGVFSAFSRRALCKHTTAGQDVAGSAPSLLFDIHEYVTRIRLRWHTRKPAIPILQCQHRHINARTL